MFAMQVDPLKAAAESIHKPATILVVDDESRIRLALRNCLEAEGYIVEEARDGAEAIGVILDTRPDLMFLDLAMPRMDGMSLLRELRARFRDIMPRTIVLTAWGSDAAEEEAFLLGVRGFVPKPPIPQVLRAIAERVLAQRSDVQTKDRGDADGGSDSNGDSPGDRYLG
jgi:CheY-like chemotaxis protein